MSGAFVLYTGTVNDLETHMTMVFVKHWGKHTVDEGFQIVLNTLKELIDKKEWTDLCKSMIACTTMVRMASLSITRQASALVSPAYNEMDPTFYLWWKFYVLGSTNLEEVLQYFAAFELCPVQWNNPPPSRMHQNQKLEEEFSKFTFSKDVYGVFFTEPWKSLLLESMLKAAYEKCLLQSELLQAGLMAIHIAKYNPKVISTKIAEWLSKKPDEWLIHPSKKNFAEVCRKFSAQDPPTYEDNRELQAVLQLLMMAKHKRR